MEERIRKLDSLKSYLNETDKEVTLILQTLQWDRGTLNEKKELVSCQINSSHKLIKGKQEEHHKRCLFSSNGYTDDDLLLPDVVGKCTWKLDKNQIQQIIENASADDLMFKRGPGHNDALEPLSLDRLQSTYTSDERRAIHDFVVISTKQPDKEYADLTLFGADTPSNVRVKSRVEVLAEQRDMKRRRTKYRVAPKTKNYSDVLRDVIKTQIEVYTEVLAEKNKIKQETKDDSYSNNSPIRNPNKNRYDRHESSRRDNGRHKERYEHRSRERGGDRSRERGEHRSEEISRDRDRSRDREHRHIKREDNYSSREKHRKDKHSFEQTYRNNKADRSHHSKDKFEKSEKDENRKRHYSEERHYDYKSSRSKEDRKKHKQSKEDRNKKRDKYYRDEQGSDHRYNKVIDRFKIKEEKMDL